MRSRPWLLTFAFVGLAVAVVVILAASSGEKKAFNLGVIPAAPVIELGPRQVVCQAPIVVPDADAAFDRIVVVLGTYERKGPPVLLTLEDERTDKTVARSKLAGGYPDITAAPTHTFQLGRQIDTRTPLRVCLRNQGPNRVAVYGNGDAASRTSTASIDGQPANVDLGLTFERPEARSSLSLVPAILERASLWRAPWIGGWLYVLLVLVILIGVPTLVALAVRDVSADRPDR